MPSFQIMLYTPIKYSKYLFYTLAASCLAYYPLGAFVPAILFQIGELAFIFTFKVYKDRNYLIFRVVENSTLIIISIIMIVIYAISGSAEK